MLKKMCMTPMCKNIDVTSRHHCPASVSCAELAPHSINCRVVGSVTEAPPVAAPIATNTAAQIPTNACVTIMVELAPPAQGTGMTGWNASSGSSPRCAASCRTHHSQILRSENGGSFRPHCVQFAISLRSWMI
jgi:hypothetical protein